MVKWGLACNMPWLAQQRYVLYLCLISAPDRSGSSMPRPGPVWAGVENLAPTGFQSLDLLATSSGYKYNYLFIILYQMFSSVVRLAVKPKHTDELLIKNIHIVVCHGWLLVYDWKSSNYHSLNFILIFFVLTQHNIDCNTSLLYFTLLYIICETTQYSITFFTLF
jgi:multisubunit Na+/H+ antiporter MnhF subunit